MKVLFLLLVLFFPGVAPAQEPAEHLDRHAARVPAGVLLTGGADDGFLLATATTDVLIPHQLLSGEPFITSRDGSMIVAHGVDGKVLLYSRQGATWLALRIACEDPAVISPDDAMLLCLRYTRAADRMNIIVQMDRMDLATRKDSPGPQIARYPTVNLGDVKASEIPAGTAIPFNTQLGFFDWSPRSNQVVFETRRSYLAPMTAAASGPASAWDNTSASEIDILDLATGSVHKLAEGVAPSWSPSGEWIAFFQRGKKEALFLVHPDGTDLHPVGTIWTFVDMPAVWSPDSSRILLNRCRDGEDGDFAIEVLDLQTRKRTTVLRRNAYVVYRWLQVTP